ncbi:hypothetical protein ElyMa_004826600 [Elysia marginata]|uniref:TGF-beta family profile domain-containing protein n=1 Tax=Elysia marginata TaxID=1093978 RepID=A0AAV4IET4_9GAST|nr:hypothetical protein ElyMa_004826600 [Elysia marginata]
MIIFSKFINNIHKLYLRTNSVTSCSDPSGSSGVVVHNLGKTRLDSFQKSSLSERDKSKRGGRVYNTKALDPGDLERIVKYIKNFTEDNGLALPGRVPGYHRKLLPSQFTKIKIWRSYMAGVRGDRQTTAQSSRLLKRLLEKQMNHIRLVNKGRNLYRQHVQTAKEAVAEKGISDLPTPLPCSLPGKMLYAFDYAQQVHPPSSPMQPGPIYFLTLRKCGLFGVCCPGLPEQVNFVVDEGMCCGKGSNSVIS